MSNDDGNDRPYLCVVTANSDAGTQIAAAETSATLARDLVPGELKDAFLARHANFIRSTSAGGHPGKLTSQIECMIGRPDELPTASHAAVWPQLARFPSLPLARIGLRRR